MPGHSARKSRWWIGLLLIAVTAGVLWLAAPWLRQFVPTLAIWQRGGTAGNTGSKPPAREIPVVVATAQTRDVPIYLNALGTVQGFRTVTIRSRVEGELTKVAFTEGQLVRQGDLLAEIDPRQFQVQLKQAQAQLTKDQAALRVATADYNRYEKLVANNAVTQQQLDATRGLMQQAQGAIKADEAQIESANLQLSYCQITSPIDGRIGLRNVDRGNIVAANDPTGLAVVAQLQPIAVLFPIPQDEIVRVQQAFNAGKKLAVQAYDRGLQNKLASGTLLAIDNQVDAATGTVRIKAEFANQDNLLFPNQFVNARLLIETLPDVVVVPTAAVQRGPDGHFVYVLQSDSTVEPRMIEAGPSEGDQTVIEQGLAQGEQVITEGLDKLQSGSKVVARDSKPATADDVQPEKAADHATPPVQPVTDESKRRAS
ncbi:MAG: MdtA/MuxA family multidrug efflux RND transporter periplasmic adaptor subunit [Pirellulales bacterium]